MAITTARLEEMRLVADNQADLAIQAIIDSGDTAAVNQLFQSLSSNSGIPDDCHPAVKTFFETQQGLPKDVDWEKIKHGQRFFVNKRQFEWENQCDTGE